MRRWTLSAVLATAVITLVACTAAATPSPSASTAPSVAASPSAPASVAPTAVATVPADQLIFPAAGKLVACMDQPYPPQNFFDDQGNPTGADVELGTELGKRLGLTAQFENSVFETIIAALTGGRCDIILSEQNITPDRQNQVDMIPYFRAGQSFVVAKGNPKAINVTDDLCGKVISAETGTTEVDYLNGTGDYKGKGLSAACTAKGLAAIDVKEFPRDTDALAALLGGQVDAYFADSPVAGYYTVQHADQFDLSPIPPLDPALEGISVAKDHTALRDAVKAALLSMVADGSYLNIMKKYGLESGTLQAADIK